MGVLIQSSGNFQKMVGLYENPLIEYWQDKYADEVKNSMIPILFDRAQSDNPTEAISELNGAIDFTQWNGEFTYSPLSEGNTKVFTPIIFQAGVAYDRFLLSNAKLVNLKTEHGMFAIGAARTREMCAAGMFTNADLSAGYTVNGVLLNWNKTADGQPLASASHTIAKTGGTQSNLLSLELNEENLETACQIIFDMKDENNNLCGLCPDTLVVPTALRKRALEIVGSTGKSDTADNNANVYDGNLQVATWKYYRKQTGKTGQPWCVMDSSAAKQSLKWFNRLESGDDYELISWKKEETQIWSIGSLMWFSAGAYDYRPMVFSIPA